MGESYLESLRQKHLAWAHGRQQLLLTFSRAAVIWNRFLLWYHKPNGPSRDKPQNYREYLQPCPLALYRAISEQALSEQLVQSIKSRTNCTWFMVAWLKHRILRSGDHLLVVHRELSHVSADGSSFGCLMGEEELLMSMAQLLSHSGWGACSWIQKDWKYSAAFLTSTCWV